MINYNRYYYFGAVDSSDLFKKTETMKEQPKSGETEIVWFIENKDTHEWLWYMPIMWTTDPEKAIRFRTKEDANAYINEGRRLKALSVELWFPTEHEFISRVSGEPPKPDAMGDDGTDPMDEEGWDDVRLIIGLNRPDEAAMLIRQLIEPKLKKLSGEAKTPDRVCGQNCNCINDQQCPFNSKGQLKELTGGSVPTPSDEDIHAAARAYSLKKENENFNLSPSERNEIITLSGFGFQDGAKWFKEWLRSSTGDNFVNSANKG